MEKIKTLLPKAIMFMVGVGCLMLTLFVFNVNPAMAQDVATGLAGTGGASGLTDAPLTEIIGNIIKVFLSTLGVIFLVLVLYAGFLWMTSQGDPDKITRAKRILINATIGLIIILASYAITAFIINALTGAMNGSGGSTSYTNPPPVERLSGSLGSGGIQDHYPERNASEVARNTSIFVTFKDEMDPASFIADYESTETGLNTSNILIYVSGEGEGEAFESDEIVVSFTEDFKTFVFDPVDLLGSSTEDQSYTVYLNDAIEDSDGDTVLNDGGYEWSFEVGTEIDLTPPTVRSVVPAASGSYDRNIIVEITFSEAMNPTSATGVRESDSGFDNIQTTGTDGVPTAGTYEISNQYRTVTFTSDDPCGTNSCGDTIYCLPGGQTITVTAIAPETGVEPPQVDIYPYPGLVDVAGNALDGDGDGTAGDDYTWSFTTTNDIDLTAPEIAEISPNISEEEVALDQEVFITFDSVMMSSTLTSSSISLDPIPEHEMAFWVRLNSLDSTGAEAIGSDVVATQVEIDHGVFLETVDGGITYYYAAEIPRMGDEIDFDNIKNQYQNCFVPGEGPDATGGTCGTSSGEPYCCQGEPSATECIFYSSE